MPAATRTRRLFGSCALATSAMCRAAVRNALRTSDGACWAWRRHSARGISNAPDNLSNFAADILDDAGDPAGGAAMIVATRLKQPVHFSLIRRWDYLNRHSVAARLKSGP